MNALSGSGSTPAINPFGALTPHQPSIDNPFSAMFSRALGHVNDRMLADSDNEEKLMEGDLTDTHTMTIQSAKSDVLLHITTQLAQKFSACTTQLFQMQL